MSNILANLSSRFAKERADGGEDATGCRLQAAVPLVLLSTIKIPTAFRSLGGTDFLSVLGNPITTEARNSAELHRRVLDFFGVVGRQKTGSKRHC